MKNWRLFTLSFLIVSTSALASVKAYFNYSPSSYYTDPYRGITRNGDNLEAVIIHEINNAQRSILVAVQELRLPRIAAALIQKHRQGLDVRVILENDYNFDVLSQIDVVSDGEHEASKLNELRALIDVNRNGRFEREELETRDAIYMLRKARVPLIDDTADGSKGSGLMHHKFVVVDGRSTIVSTANFSMGCIHGDILNPNSRGNDNSLIVVQAPSFASLFTEEFNQMWGTGRRGNFGLNKTYRGPRTVTVRGVKLTVQFSPTSRRLMWEETVNGLIASELAKARQSIKAALFVFSDQKISNIMERRQSAGAHIGTFIEPKFAFRDYSELLDMMGLQLLSPACVYEQGNNPWKRPAREVGMGRPFPGDVLHHKFAVVDGRAVIMGSQNWSNAANYVNDESVVVIEGKGVSDLYTQEYERIKRNARFGPSNNLVEKIRDMEDYCRRQGFYF